MEEGGACQQSSLSGLCACLGCTNPSSVTSDRLPQESGLPAPNSGNSHGEAMAFSWAGPASTTSSHCSAQYLAIVLTKWPESN